MTALTDFRDHARKMAAWHPKPPSGRLSAQCQGGKFSGPPTHDCRWWASCPCECHPRTPDLPEAERALWVQLADEIDAYLAARHAPAADLFGEAGVEPEVTSGE